MWPLLIILFIGSTTLVVGYVGCFSIVQSSHLSTAPVVWLGTEAALSIIRMVFWALNPSRDDADPMKFCFDLAEHPPLPTCNRFSDEIDQEKDLPVVRGSKFLRNITSYAGPINRFDDAGISLYYTLTRKDPSKNINSLSGNHAGHADRKLYITLFDYKEGTTRVFFQDKDKHKDEDKLVNYLYLADPLAVDMTSDILETKLRKKIDLDEDSIMGNQYWRDKLILHYNSILDSLQKKDKEGQKKAEVTNDWTLLIDGKGVQHEPEPYVENDRPEHNDGCKADLAYINHGRLERKTMLPMFEKRGQWIMIHMSQVRKNTEEELTKLVDVSKITKTDVEEIQIMFLDELKEMVCMLIVESQVWEFNLLKKHQVMMATIQEEVEEGNWVLKDLQKDWLRNMRRRHFKERESMHKRLKHQKDQFWSDLIMTGVSKIGLDKAWTNQRFHKLVDYIDKEWEGTHIKDYTDFSIPETLESHQKRLISSLDDHMRTMKTRIRNSKVLKVLKAYRENMRYRLFNEWEDMKDRIKQKIVPWDDQFSRSENIAHFQLTRQQTVTMDPQWIQKDGEAAISHALKRNKNVLKVDFQIFDQKNALENAILFTHKMPSLTTIAISNWSSIKLAKASDGQYPFLLFRALEKALQQNKNIVSMNTPVNELPPIIQTALQSNIDSVKSSGKTSISFEGSDADRLTKKGKVWIRFHGTNGGLKLKFYHHTGHHGSILKITEESKGDLHLDIPIPTLAKVEDIRLEPDCHFTPGASNTLSIVTEPSCFYNISNIELLDSQDFPYDYAPPTMS